MTNIFEQASRGQFRFPTSKGLLDVEQLWDLPLTSERNLSLDAVAKQVNAELRGVTEESFVQTAASNPVKAELETKLEVVKYIIAVRLAENEAARNAAAKRAEKAKLLELIADKQDESLKNLTEDELRERVAAL